jgi:hypothetical protein
MISNKNFVKTVISASRRTDIPAFFYDWLQDALTNGVVEIPNPLFPEKKYLVDLNPINVHSLVLWSKDFKNVLEKPLHLDDYNLYFQYTINNYSKFLEPNVPDYKNTINTLYGLLKRYKPEQFNIRFDPVIISTMGEIVPSNGMSEKSRITAFEVLCRDLKVLGMEKCRVTTSYLSLYGHVKDKLKKSGLDLVEMSENSQISFFESMVEIADKYDMQIFSCSSPVIEKVTGINKGHCIDGELLEQLFGGKIKKAKDKGQRAACGCTCSRDIGIYAKNRNGMKCLHGCIYCYVMDN